MNLLIYSHFFAPSIGGVETIVKSLASGLAELRDSRGTREFEIALITKTPAGSHDDTALPFPLVRQPGLFQLWRLIRKSDLVHLAGPAVAPLLLVLLARKPLVIEHHGYQAVCPNGLLFHHPSQTVCPGHFAAANYLECLSCNREVEGRWGSARLLASTFLRNWGSRRANTNIAPSYHVALRLGLPRTEVIAHGVPLPPPEKENPAFPSALAAKTFAYVGRLVTEKGVSVLIEAARLLQNEGHDFRVLLLGDGPDRPRLEKRIAASGLERLVRITGFLPAPDLARELSCAGTVVIPTIMEETAGLAALEQMARGRLVIASKIGGLPEAVGDAGLTFPPADPPALAGAMAGVLSEPSFIEELGRKARERVRSLFLFPKMIAKHARVFRQVSKAS
ncbi:MAG TPA: glycosyltransferase family 4 protein [Candidatus Acidoferrum sp.]|nr:glycosyltransferase family 4 protein [Candidatus Acidoferrum sp.]